MQPKWQRCIIQSDEVGGSNPPIDTIQGAKLQLNSKALASGSKHKQEMLVRCNLRSSVGKSRLDKRLHLNAGVAHVGRAIAQ